LFGAKRTSKCYLPLLMCDLFYHVLEYSAFCSTFLFQLFLCELFRCSQLIKFVSDLWQVGRISPGTPSSVYQIDADCSEITHTKITETEMLNKRQNIPRRDRTNHTSIRGDNTCLSFLRLRCSQHQFGIRNSGYRGKFYQPATGH
jgi:hypothetical protein